MYTLIYNKWIIDAKNEKCFRGQMYIINVVPLAFSDVFFFALFLSFCDSTSKNKRKLTGKYTVTEKYKI